jgi:hypothetical protein
VRTEACACGGSITAPSLERSGQYVAAHVASPVHQTWRNGFVLSDLALEGVPRGLRDYRDPRRHTAVHLGVSGSTGSVCGSARTTGGASAVEGAD